MLVGQLFSILTAKIDDLILLRQLKSDFLNKFTFKNKFNQIQKENSNENSSKQINEKSKTAEILPSLTDFFRINEGKKIDLKPEFIEVKQRKSEVFFVHFSFPNSEMNFSSL